MHEDLLILELNARWQWQIPFGWIPISGDEIIADIEIYHANYFDFFAAEITEAIERIYNSTEVYELAEDGQISIRPVADCTFFYDGLERLYTDKSFRFMRYFSHETSVTAGGKELLAEIHKIWPEYKHHLWQADYWNYPPTPENF